MESKFSMAMPPRRWVGYALLAAGLALLLDTCTFFLTNWSPLKVPMYGPNELAVGCLSTIAGVLVLASSTLKRTPLRIQVGAALIMAAASIYGGWEWWLATRTWVPLYMPVSLAKGHIRSPEFKINLDAGFWIFVEIETKVDDEGVSCLTGYASDYCQKNGVRQLHASWTLSDRGRVVARSSTDDDQGSRGGYLTKARGIGHFLVPSGKHFVLDVDFPDDNSHFNVGNPRLGIEQSYDWQFEDDRAPVILLALLVGIGGVTMVVKREDPGTWLVLPGRSIIRNPPMVFDDLRWAQRLPLRRQFSSIPAFALVAAPFLLILLVIFMIFSHGSPARGLYVSIRKPDRSMPIQQEDDTVVVRIVDAAPGKVPAIYINSRLSSWGTLSNDLKGQVKIHPQWVVYVQAGPNLPWADVVRAIEVAKAIPAKVVLLPSDTRNASSRSLEKVVVKRRSRSGKIYSSR